MLPSAFPPLPFPLCLSPSASPLCIALCIPICLPTLAPYFPTLHFLSASPLCIIPLHSPSAFPTLCSPHVAPSALDADLLKDCCDTACTVVCTVRYGCCFAEQSQSAISADSNFTAQSMADACGVTSLQPVCNISRQLRETVLVRLTQSFNSLLASQVRFASCLCR